MYVALGMKDHYWQSVPGMTLTPDKLDRCECERLEFLAARKTSE